MARKAKPKPVQDETEPQKPQQTTLTIPAIGQVTIRAVTGPQINTLRPANGDPVAHTMAVIQAGTVSPPLDRAAQVAIANKYGEAPLLRLFGAIMGLSGLTTTVARYTPTSVVRQWHS